MAPHQSLPQAIKIDLIINAGGSSRRMGVDKALLPVPPHETPLLRYIVETLTDVGNGETIIVANDQTLSAKAGLAPAVRQVRDGYGDAGALGGLATGLACCRGWAMVVACDMPLLNPRLFLALSALAEQSENTGGGLWDAVVPVTDGHFQPLHALYHRRCLPAIEETLRRGDLRVMAFYDAVRVRTMSEMALRAVDPELHSFFNVNTPEDWQAALGLLDRRARGEFR